MRGQDGIVLNSTLMIADFAAGRRFFEQQQGWHKRWEASPKWLAERRTP